MSLSQELEHHFSDQGAIKALEECDAAEACPLCWHHWASRPNVLAEALRRYPFHTTLIPVNVR